MASSAVRGVTTADDVLRDVLRSNTGFDDVERWLPYARRHSFRRTPATAVKQCPDCGVPASAAVLGQFVYYSTLMRLRECAGCGLVYSDVDLSADVIARHFETAYKDAEYFEVQRSAIFAQVLGVIDSLLPPGGTVLDVGGAQGHLLEGLSRHRTDADLALLDLSESACAFATHHFGIRATPGTLVDADIPDASVDVLTMLDVAYYERRVSDMWTAMHRVLKPGGSFILRIPNRLGLIKVLQPLVHSRLQTRVPSFNPEHLSIFGQRYLTTRLPAYGFENVHFRPAARLRNGKRDVPASVFDGLVAILHRLNDRLILSPSMLVTGQRAPDGKAR